MSTTNDTTPPAPAVDDLEKRSNDLVARVADLEKLTKAFCDKLDLILARLPNSVSQQSGGTTNDARQNLLAECVKIGNWTFANFTVTDYPQLQKGTVLHQSLEHIYNGWCGETLLLEYDAAADRNHADPRASDARIVISWLHKLAGEHYFAEPVNHLPNGMNGVLLLRPQEGKQSRYGVRLSDFPMLNKIDGEKSLVYPPSVGDYEEAMARIYYPHDEPVTMHLASDFGAAGSADLDAAIGAMLDEWDRLPNDLKWDSDHVRLRAKVEALEAAALRRNPNQSGGGQ